ncbi:MAG: 3-deoxy-manno-octulosonate cytidylyltransferase [Ignavibacteria bacterium]|jgi:3-deoxy-manno-octulosonate cytidylyltransferase (CMP-KDO synthetase)
MIVGIIPARYAATRLPGKPLVDLCGQTMIERVWRAAHTCEKLDRVIIATDSELIAEEARRIGAEVALTDPELPSGTDRCYAVVQQLEKTPDVVINIQGDEPLLQPRVLAQLVDALAASTADVSTPVTRITHTSDLADPNIVKVAMGSDRKAVYFSRSPIPYLRGVEHHEWLNHQPYWKHIGVYAYRTAALVRHVGLPVSGLERSESLEQLRLLEAGTHFVAVETDVEFISVDTPEDAERVRAYLTQHPLV